MTDQTIPVPADLARRLIASFPAHAATRELKALIPTPPKVGDKLTEAQIAALPPKAVLRDSDNDLWIIGEQGRIHLVTFKQSGSLTDDEQIAYDAAAYDPVLVSLPEA